MSGPEWRNLSLWFAAAAVTLGITQGAAAESCRAQKARAEFEKAKALQAELETEAALEGYQRCLSAEPDCVACQYEIGWSFWKQGEWAKVVGAWERILKLDPGHREAKQFLPTARANLAIVEAEEIPTQFRTQVELSTRSSPLEGPVTIHFVARHQSYNRKPKHPLDFFDPEIQSPKSVRFSSDGKRVYVNSLEAGKTVIYDGHGYETLGAISHRFQGDEKGLFDSSAVFDYRFAPSVKKPNRFTGKPVELELTHGGRYLWIPYYRRSFDAKGSMPSAMAVVDTRDDRIVRVLGTGPISKFVRVSPKGKWLAVSHWGDNTVGLFDIGSKEPSRWRRKYLMTVEKRLSLKKLGADRDKDCGFCVRGLEFTPDERFLFVSRMKGGGIAVFEIPEKGRPVYLGTVFGILPGPRDLEISRDGKSLFASCNASGFVARLPVEKLLQAVKSRKAGGKATQRVELDADEIGAVKGFVGLGARSIRLSPDGTVLFVAVNQTSELVAVDASTLGIVARIPVDSYPVGLDISPDGKQIWTTSQGREAKGGNSIGIYQVRYKRSEVIHALPSAEP